MRRPLGGNSGTGEIDRLGDFAQLDGPDRGGFPVEHHEDQVIAMHVRQPDLGNRSMNLSGLQDMAVRVANVEQRILGAGFIIEHEQPFDLVDADADLVRVLAGHGTGDDGLFNGPTPPVVTALQGRVRLMCSVALVVEDPDAKRGVQWVHRDKGFR